MIAEDDIREVRDRTDMVDLVGERVTLRKKGRLFWGLCPFHQEKTPSFKVDPSVGLYHCFGCGEGGDAYRFVMELDGLDFVDAVRLLADRAHYELRETTQPTSGPSRNRLREGHRLADAFYGEQLMKAESATAAREYLAGRGFHSEIARHFGVGWAEGGDALTGHLRKKGVKDDEIVTAGLAVRTEGGRVVDRFKKRVMFPIRDTSGRTVAFGGRVLDDSQPKYLNSADTPLFKKSRVLYAMDMAKESMGKEKTAIVVEGYTDVIAAHGAGFTNVVATLGTAFTQDHLRLLGRFADRVVLVFDADEAGFTAAERSLAFVSEYGLPGAGLVASIIDEGKVDVRVAVLPEGQDPADLASSDPDEFGRVVADAVPLVDFAIARRIARHDTGELAGRLEAARDALGILKSVTSPVARREYLEDLSSRLQVEVHTLEAELERLPAPAQDRRPVETVARPAPARQGNPAEIELEREALAALLDDPDLLNKHADVLSPGLFGSEDARQVFEAVAEAGEGANAEDLLAVLTNRPDATASLAAALLGDEDGQPPTGSFDGIVRRLKEFALRRQIDETKARLASAERASEPIEEIQAQLWELQREQHRWRDEADEHSAERTTEDE